MDFHLTCSFPHLLCSFLHAQCVDSTLSTNYVKIKQLERPMKCELCSVDDKVTAFHPLVDYHGKSVNAESDFDLFSG